MNDFQIRSALKPKLLKKYANDTNTIIIEELGVIHGEARVDLAVINGSLHGYELKSSKDTLYRLPDQINSYNLVFDRMTLIVEKCHVYESIKIIPEWWGIKIVEKSISGKIKFHTIRRSSNNPNPDPISILKLLWKEEALNFLKKYDCDSKIRSKKRNEIYTKIVEIVKLETIKNFVRNQLICRPNWRSVLQPMLNDD